MGRILLVVGGRCLVLSHDNPGSGFILVTTGPRQENYDVCSEG